MSGYRLPTGGDIDRGSPITFTFDGRTHAGFAGDTLASALLGAGVDVVARSIRHDRPRGIVTAGPEEPSGFVALVDGHARELVPATAVELEPGLVVERGHGKGTLAVNGSWARHDQVRAHADVLLVGGGPAGLAAASVAARSGARVILIEASARFGGSSRDEPGSSDERRAAERTARLAAELRDHPYTRLLTRTTCLGLYDGPTAVAVERRLDPSPTRIPGRPRHRLWHIDARSIVVATGMLERPIAFASNDRPGVMLAGAVHAYLRRHGVAAGRRAVLFTTNDGAYATAVALHRAGVDVAAVVDARRHGPAGPVSDAILAAGIPVRTGFVVTRTDADARGAVAAVRVDAIDGFGEGQVIGCDLLAVSGGWDPNPALVTDLGGALRWDASRRMLMTSGLSPSIHVAGGSAGERSLADCLRSGDAAGRAALAAIGLAPSATVGPEAGSPWSDPGDEPLWVVGGADAGAADDPEARRYVDLHRDVTVADIEQAIRAGLRSLDHVKRYTLLGTGPDQGRIAGSLAAGVLAASLGSDIGEIGSMSQRPPAVPVAFEILAGRERGSRWDPVRRTAMHDRHVALGAVFEPVGQWLRPRYYPAKGEGMAAAVERECLAVRTAVGMADASTLGKVDLQGPDVGEFLDRIYTNTFSTLGLGRARYGLMLRLDGMVFDDGVTTRIGERQYHMTTTTGHAAAVMDWLEEWLQTEWPDLRVHATSVTERWAVIVVTGPKARAVLRDVAPDLDLSPEAFPHMTMREARIAGIPGRVFRISFTGELAYEVNVPWWHGAHAWDAIAEAGRPHRITPYGTEAMHVLRAEKGYFIVGQETDGSVTPVDLGLERMLSTSKPFLGRRSLRRAALVRDDRKQLVGLRPCDPGATLVEGSQLVVDAGVPLPVPMLGHVTSAYRSATLGHSFALALLKGGRSRHGEILQAVHLDSVTDVTVCDPVFYDPEGLRLAG